MTIPVTPETVRATYEHLLAFPPFCNWKMHPAKKLTFLIVPYTGEYAQFDTEKMELRVSAAAMSKHHTLLKKVAHEMIHVYEHASGRWTTTHDTAFFFKCRDRVCKHFDFDPLDF